MERKAACILLQDARGLLYLLLFLSSNREMSDKLLELHRHLGERLAGRGDVFLGVLLLLDGGRDGGGVGRLLGELADFVGDDGEPAAVLAARAASMAAFSDRRFVCSAMLVIVPTICWMSSE